MAIRSANASLNEWLLGLPVETFERLQSNDFVKFHEHLLRVLTNNDFSQNPLDAG